MKKLIFAAIMIAALILSGCGDKCPENIYSTTYEIGQKAVKCYEDYQNGKMLNAEFRDQIDDYYDALNALEFNETIPKETEYLDSNVFLKGKLLGISVMSINEKENETDIIKFINDVRNFLETGIGYPQKDEVAQ